MSRILMDLGITSEMLAGWNLSQCEEAKTLEIAEISKDGREHLLVKEAAEAWSQLKKAAEIEGEEIYIVSAYRSISRQAEIIREKIKQGLNIEEILRVCAPPGFSEHHTGRALDISTSGTEDLSEEFEKTTAFTWLCKNGSNFKFSLSYPRGNTSGYQYEPWHWCYDVT